jgi:hypothetical protein
MLAGLRLMLASAKHDDTQSLRIPEPSGPADRRLVKLIDHPICSRHFRLQPGEHITWDEQFEIPDLVAGQAKITTAIQIVNPRNCEKYKCYDTMLEA